MKKKKILALYLAGAMVFSGLSFEMLSPCAAEVQQAVDINVEESQQEIAPNAAKLQDVDENAGKTALSNINAYIIVNGGKPYTFTGHEIIPAVKLVLEDGAKVIPSEHYTMEYYKASDENLYDEPVTSIIDAGTYLVKINLNSKIYCNDESAPLFGLFNVNQADLGKAALSVAATKVTYCGKPYGVNGLEVKYSGEVVSPDNYDVVCSGNTIDTGTVDIVVTGKNNFAGQKSISYMIATRKLQELDFKLSTQAVASCEAGAQPRVGISNPELYDMLNDQYAVSYQDFSTPGKKMITVSAKAKQLDENQVVTNLVGSVKLHYIIADEGNGQKLVNNFRAVVIEEENCIYTGEEIRPHVIVSDGNQVLTEGKDYEVEYSNNVNVGVRTAAAIVVGKGNYYGQKLIPFSIAKRPINMNNLEMSLDYPGMKENNQIPYSAREIVPKVVIKSEGVVLPENEYLVEVTDNVEPGSEAKVQITFKNICYCAPEDATTIEGPSFTVVPVDVSEIKMNMASSVFAANKLDIEKQLDENFHSIIQSIVIGDVVDSPETENDLHSVIAEDVPYEFDENPNSKGSHKLVVRMNPNYVVGEKIILSYKVDAVGNNVITNNEGNKNFKTVVKTTRSNLKDYMGGYRDINGDKQAINYRVKSVIGKAKRSDIKWQDGEFVEESLPQDFTGKITIEVSTADRSYKIVKKKIRITVIPEE